MEAVKPLLGDGVLLLSDTIVEVGGRVYVEATASYSIGEKKIEVKGYAREPEEKKGMDNSQITGATSSYARKYALNGLFAIDDAKDADSMDNSQDQTTTVKKQLEKCKTREEVMKIYTANAGSSPDVKAMIIEKGKTINK